MRVLIITAHPNKDGFTHKIAENLKEVYEGKGARVREVDLYETEFAERVLTFGRGEKWPGRVVLERYQAMITEAEEIVLVFPVWWYDAPAVMKNYYDCVFERGFAFEKEGLKIKGKLGDKRVRIYVTADGPKFYYWLAERPVRKLWKRRLGFCGIGKVEYMMLASMYKKEKPEREAWLRKIKEGI